jgi:AbrB family looped-hinge helix DNA binding protein
MDALVGPTPIAKNGQVTVPKRIMDALGWSGGDQVMLRVSEDDPDVLRVIPEAVVLRQLGRGEAAERMMRITGHTQAAKESQQKPDA